MSDSVTLYEEVYKELLTKVTNQDLTTDEAANLMKNFKLFSESRPPAPEPEPEPIPTTIWGKVKVGTARVWDNDTTRVFLQAGGAFAGVALVTWTTIHRDHVIERTAMSQANQRNS